MQNFKNLLIFFLGISFSALIWGIIIVFLQKTPIFYIPNYKIYSFYPINLTKIFFNHFETPINLPIYTLKGVKLKALYFDGKQGFVILKEHKKTSFIDLNSYYKGYKLIKIGPNYAIFEKNNKKYKLTIENSNFKYKTNQNINSVNIIVSKQTFESYKNNLNKIWQNISIIKVKEGYLITYIKPHSIFYKIGLRPGDILLEVNGRKLKNDADAWNLYKNADKFNFFEIKIKRNNKIKVLKYEVD